MRIALLLLLLPLLCLAAPVSAQETTCVEQQETKSAVGGQTHLFFRNNCVGKVTVTLNRVVVKSGEHKSSEIVLAKCQRSFGTVWGGERLVSISYGPSANPRSCIAVKEAPAAEAPAPKKGPSNSKLQELLKKSQQTSAAAPDAAKKAAEQMRQGTSEADQVIGDAKTSNDDRAAAALAEERRQVDAAFAEQRRRQEEIARQQRQSAASSGSGSTEVEPEGDCHFEFGSDYTVCWRVDPGYRPSTQCGPFFGTYRGTRIRYCDGA